MKSKGLYYKWNSHSKKGGTIWSGKKTSTEQIIIANPSVTPIGYTTAVVVYMLVMWWLCPPPHPKNRNFCVEI